MAFVPSTIYDKHGKSRSSHHLLPSMYTTQQPHSPTALGVVADPPMKENEKKKEKKEDDSEDWIESKNGGFIPNIRARLRQPLVRSNRNPADGTHILAEDKTLEPKWQRAPMVLQVSNIQDYKTQIVDVRDKMVCVRFYAPWCKACKAVEGSFHRMSREYEDVKFVEVLVTKENAYLHKGLGVPSLPFGHIYHPVVGLVEERKINKKIFNEFKQVLQTYVDGQCRVSYSEDGSSNFFG